MKKTVWLSMLLWGTCVNAQLPDGSIAPDFTFTDLNGVSHHLYDYLDEGKTVVLDVSAAWCNPCWNYHSSHELEALYAAHGPAGFNGVDAGTTDNVMVFLIEAEQTNTVDQIMGVSLSTGGYAGFSMGNWTDGTSYPIIDIPSTPAGDDFLAGYNIQSFPTIYVICPNRSVDNSYPQPATQLYTSSQNYCPDPATAVPDVAAAYAGPSHCTGDYTPVVRIQNNSQNALTSATITISEAGNVVSSTSWTGNLAAYAFETVTCSIIPNFDGGQLDIVVTTNGDSNPANGLLHPSPGAIVVNNVITVAISTDLWPEETSWEILDANGVAVPGTQSTQLTANVPQEFTYTLPGTGCYTFAIADTGGDGIFNGSTQNTTVNGALEVRDATGQIIMNNIDFGDGKNTLFKVTEDVNGIGEAEFTAVAVYPNPVENTLFVGFTATHSNYSVLLTDLSGRTIMSRTTDSSGEQLVLLPVEEVAPGSYTVRISDGESVVVRSVVIR